MVKKADIEREAYTPVEINNMLNNLTKADYLRMINTAKSICWGNLPFTAEDLLADALCRALDGTRKWYKDAGLTCLVQFIYGIMRSIVSECLKKQKSDPLHQPFESDFSGEDDSAMYGTSDSPEELLLAQEALDFYIKIFSEEKEATKNIFLAKLEGYSPCEIKNKYSLTDTQYDSGVKAIKRKINQLESIRGQHNVNQ